MGQHVKPDIVSLIASIGDMALLPKIQPNQIKFTRAQLLELYVFVRELKKSRDELLIKVECLGENK